jgi:hypothetical protein
MRRIAIDKKKNIRNFIKPPMFLELLTLSLIQLLFVLTVYIRVIVTINNDFKLAGGDDDLNDRNYDIYVT